MGVLSKGTDFSNGDQVTDTNLDNLVDNATFTSSAVDGSTTDISGAGAIIVRDGGITSSKFATGVVGAENVTATGSTEPRSINDRFAETVNVKDFGAVGDGVTDDSTAVNAAITAVSASGGGFVDFDNIYVSAPIYLKTNVILRGKGLGTSGIYALAGWSGNIVETYNFAALEAAGTADTSEGCPVSYGLMDCFVNGSSYNGTVSATQGYGVRLYGRQLMLQRVIIGKIAGIGLYTSFPAAPSYTSFDSITDTKFSVIKDVEIIETGYEGFVFNGPTDQYLDNIYVGFTAGSRNDTYDTTGAKTSLLFPTEQIHALRILRSTEFGFIHAFDNEYGYAVYVKRQSGDPAIRLRGNYLMGESSYGCVYIDANVRGNVNLIETHNNYRGPTTGGAYSGSAGLNPHVSCNSDLGFIAKIDCYRENDEQGSDGVYLSGTSLDIHSSVFAYASSFAGGGKGLVNDCASSKITARIAAKSGAGTLDYGYEESSVAANNSVEIISSLCDVNVSFLGGTGSDSGSMYTIKTRSAGTTEINNIARLAQEPYLQANILTDDGTYKRRNKFIASVAVNFATTGLQTLSIPYGNFLVRDPLEDEIQLTVSYDTGTFAPIARLAVSNIDTVSKEVDCFIECTGGATGTGKINLRIG
jgi:hypothetical protein